MHISLCLALNLIGPLKRELPRFLKSRRIQFFIIGTTSCITFELKPTEKGRSNPTRGICHASCNLPMHYGSACDHLKTFLSNYGFIILIFSVIFRPFQRSKLELPQINRKLNFDQFRALNFQNRTNGSKVMVILQFWK